MCKTKINYHLLSFNLGLLIWIHSIYTTALRCVMLSYKNLSIFPDEKLHGKNITHCTISKGKLYFLRNICDIVPLTALNFNFIYDILHILNFLTYVTFIFKFSFGVKTENQFAKYKLYGSRIKRRPIYLKIKINS